MKATKVDIYPVQAAATDSLDGSPRANAANQSDAAATPSFVSKLHENIELVPS